MLRWALAVGNEYGALGGVVSGTGGGSAWDTLQVIPLFLMLAIVVTVGAAILRLGGSDWKPAIDSLARHRVTECRKHCLPGRRRLFDKSR